MLSLLALSLTLFCPLPTPGRLAAVPPPASPGATDSVVDAAREALARGLYWRASRLIAPVLADPARRTPEIELLGARAASGWEGWSEVERLIGNATWLDSAFAGEGRALLARAALARRADSLAAEHAARAVQAAAGDTVRGERLVILARALDRLDSLPAAAAAYAGAARLLPDIGEWLTYRAAIVTRDPAERDRRFAAVTSFVARERLTAGRAEALARSADSSGAAALYASLGDWNAAYRYRFASVRGSDSARAAFRRELVEVLREEPGTGRARAAAAALDAAFAPLGAEVELAVARALASGGSSSRVVLAFERGLRGSVATSEDHYEFGRHLFALGRYAEAAREFARVKAPESLAAMAAYERARALVRDGRLEPGRRALRAIGSRFPRQTNAAGRALFLLGDLATDERRDAAARDAFRAIVARHPRASVAPAAAFRAALIAHVAGNHATAARELDDLRRLYPQSSEVAAARYWAGRALAAAGDTAAARARWRETVSADRAGYYGALASGRLGEPAWLPEPAPDRFIPVPDADSALARAALLERLGMGREAEWERDFLMERGDSSAERLLAIANAFRSHDLASRGIRLAWRAVARGAPNDARTYRLLYPLVHQEPLEAEARTHGVEPAFAAALIRQESSFTPSATSAAGARGLMQVMPAVGRAVARGLRFPVWDPVLLYQADVNVQLGMAHLAELDGRYEPTAHVLAAYNAGASRVERWKEKRGTGDVEMFIERIPYVETRNYVRIIERNRDFYRALYAWGRVPLSAAASGHRP
ncbi:MAG TPA: transglycosylase SLT domain-containing protein [Gemmatimonadales bacterium]|nr:transglycosylase SLT domain-containing protein [Gemmatimonadales bacterium]